MFVCGVRPWPHPPGLSSCSSLRSEVPAWLPAHLICPARSESPHHQQKILMAGGVVRWEAYTHGHMREAKCLGSLLTAPLALLTTRMWEADAHGFLRDELPGLNSTW